MSFYYVTDFHNGPIIPASSKSGVWLFGDDAPVIRLAIQSDAQERSIHCIIDGGDQNTWQPQGENYEDYRRSTKRICAEFNGTYLLSRGNHCYSGNGKTSDSTGPSELLVLDDLNDTSLILLQPIIIFNEKGEYYFAYDEERLQRLLSQVQTSNLVIVGHWSLQTPLQDNVRLAGFAGNSPEIQHALQNLGNKGVNILTLHGHNHCFQHYKEGNVETIVMPSPVQHDEDDRSSACGLFAEVTNGENGEGLDVHYKKVRLGNRNISPRDFTIDDVSFDEMKKYEPKEFVPPAEKPITGWPFGFVPIS